MLDFPGKESRRQAGGMMKGGGRMNGESNKRDTRWRSIWELGRNLVPGIPPPGTHKDDPIYLEMVERMPDMTI